ncbi:hypothetical protein [Methylorubrum sp. SB2]|uniref:hypothetical protein n=1 Tax=Methylorubrum subtropicum TaxID=3138812 RepID=UPI00313C98B9
MTAPTLQGAAASASDAVVMVARLWCRAEGNDPDDTISDAGHTVLDALLSGQDRKALAAIRQAEADLRAALAPPAVPESVRRAVEAFDAAKADMHRRREAGEYWHLGEAIVQENHAYDTALRFVRTLLTPTPSPDGPEVSAPPGGGGVVEDERVREWRKRAEVAEAQLAAQAALRSPDGVRYQFREIGEGEGWIDCSRASYESYSSDPHIDTRKIGDERSCTCHPSDNPPVPCAKKYALSECRAAAAAPATPEPAAGGEREIVRHKVRGTEYEVLGEAETQYSGCARWSAEGYYRPFRDNMKLIVYRSLDDGKLWCRFPDEFRDGRFETLSAPAGAQTADGGWSFDMEAAPRDGTVILLWREGWVEPSAAYWGLAPQADGAGVATKRHPWVFLDSTNGLNGFEDGERGPTAWHSMLPAPPSSTATAHDAPEGGQ